MLEEIRNITKIN